jgi:hypothetical protein
MKGKSAGPPSQQDPRSNPKVPCGMRSRILKSNISEMNKAFAEKEKGYKTHASWPLYAIVTMIEDFIG